MTLYELANDVTIQGAARLSAWYGDDEKVLSETPATDEFNIYDLDEKWEDAEVLYMFCAGDGFLHIEVEALVEDKPGFSDVSATVNGVTKDFKTLGAVSAYRL